MIDLDTGFIAYAVVSFGGILGIGADYYPVPWGALTVDTDARALRMEMTQDQIKAAPPLDKGAWPLSIDHAWLGGIYDYYGISYYR